MAKFESKSDRIESKKSAEKAELRRKSDAIMKEYLSIKDSDPKAVEKRKELEKMLKRHRPIFSDKDFQYELIQYKARMEKMIDVGGDSSNDGVYEASDEQKVEGRGDSLEKILEERAALTIEVNEYIKNKVNIGNAAQNFYDRHLIPEDLLRAEKQVMAVEAAFSSNPKLAENIKTVLFMDKEERDEYKGLWEDIVGANGLLVKTKDALKERYVAYELTRSSTDKFSEEVAGEYLKKKMGNAIEYFKEKPVQGLAAGATIAAIVYWLSSGKENSIQEKIWKVVKGVGLYGGLAFGANTLVSMYRDDGRSFLDMIFSNPDAYDYGSTMENFKSEIEGMTDNNRYAFEAMMHMANANGNAVYALFDAANRDHSHKIDSRALLSLGGLTKKQADQINETGLYDGLEALMLILAKANGKTSGNKEDQIREGMKILKEKYLNGHPDIKLATIIYLIESDGTLGKNGEVKGGKGGFDIAEIFGLSAAAGAGTDIAGGNGSGESGVAKTENPLLVGVLNDPDKKNVEGAKEAMKYFVDEQYARLDKYADSYWVQFKSLIKLGDKFKSVVKQRKLVSIERLNEIFKDKTDANPGDLKKDLAKFTSDLKLEIDDYCAVLENRDSNSETVINDLMSDMVKDMMGDEVWEKSADYVFKTINSRFELEGGSRLFDDPEILVSFMRVYFDKIEYGRDRGGIVTTKDAQDYADFFLDRATSLVPNSANISADNFDGKTKEISTEDWTRALNNLDSIDNFEVWAMTKPFAPKLIENDAVRALQERKQSEKVKEEADLQAYGAKGLDEAFKRVDGLEWSLTRDPFDAMVARRKEDYREEISKVTGDYLTAKTAIDKILDAARAEALTYSKYEERDGHGTSTVLIEVQEQMIATKLENSKEWIGGAQKVLNHAYGAYEFEDFTYLLDEPEVLVQYLDTFYKKIEGANTNIESNECDDYTRYFIWEMSKILANDPNIAVTNWDGEVKQVSTAEWQKVRVQVGQVLSYNEWLKLAPADRVRDELKANDSARAIQKRVDEEAISERSELIEGAKDQLDDIFKNLDGLEWSFTRDPFDAFIGRRKDSYMQKITNDIKGLNVKDSEPKVKAILDIARAEAESYEHFGMREDTDSGQVLREAEHAMIDRVVNQEWKAGAEKVFNYMDSSYEWEGITYVLDDPEILVSVMDEFFNKIGNGAEGFGTSPVAGASTDEYVKYYLFEMTNTLANDPNYDPINLIKKGDERVRQVSINEWKRSENKRDQILSYEEWAKSPTKRVELKVNDQARASADRAREEGYEIDKYAKDRKADIERYFEPVEDLEWNLLPSNFQAMIGKRKQDYFDKIGKLATNVVLDESQKRLMMDAVVQYCRFETYQYAQFEGRGYTSSEQVLTEIELMMLENTINSAKAPYWKDEARKVFLWAKGSYEMEGNSMVIDDPEMLQSLISLYLKKISATGGSDANSANEYTRYFIYSVNAILPNEENKGLGSRKAVSSEEWGKKAVALDGIASYDLWVKNGKKSYPELTENDPNALIELREKAEKKKSLEAFNEWFDDKMDVASWTRWDGEWPNKFRDSVKDRVLQLDTPGLNNQDYQKKLQDYAEMVEVEKKFYEIAIDNNISPDQSKDVSWVPTQPFTWSDDETISQLFEKVVRADFAANFQKGGASAYMAALNSHLIEPLKKAKVIDENTIQWGASYVHISDPLNFYPGGT